METILKGSTTTKLNCQLDKLEHDSLKGLLVVLQPTAHHSIKENLQGSRLLANNNQFYQKITIQIIILECSTFGTGEGILQTMNWCHLQ
jgi:hypothetical protein